MTNNVQVEKILLLVRFITCVFLFAECPGYKETKNMFNIISNFGCLVSDGVLEGFCFGFVGSIINEFEANRTITQPMCAAITQSGCCFASFVDIEIPSINLAIANTSAIALLRNISAECAVLGTPLSSTSCAGGSHDPCQTPFTEIASSCLDYALAFPQAIFTAMKNASLNDELCSNPCFNSTLKLAAILIEHRLYYSHKNFEC